MQSQSKLEQFSVTVEKVYDTALDKNAWPVALNSIIHFVNGSAASLTLGNTEAADFEALMFYSVGLSSEFLDGFQKYGPIWGVQSGISFWKTGEVNHLPDFLPRDEFENGIFYKELLQPHRQDDFMGLVALREGSRFATITASTDTSIERFSQDSVDSMRLLAPHICKSVSIGFAMELKQLNSSILEQTLNSLNAGIYLVQRDGRIVFMNKAAEQQIARGLGIRIISNRIKPNNAEAEDQLLHALASDTEITTAPMAIAMPDENGGLIATILRLDRGSRQNLANGSYPAIFAIFVQNPENSPLIPGEAFAKLYSLTPAEIRITLAMAPGLGPQGAADILGLSVTTVKSHLQHIFAKTGTNKQSDLIQLLMRASAPII